MLKFLAAVLLVAFVCAPASALDVVGADSVLSVSQARVDLDGNFVPDLLGRQITVAGRANVYSGVLHTSRLSVFLQDNKRGIELYNMETGEPIAEGDSVVAKGALEMYEGVTRITRATYNVFKVNRPMPRALSLSVKDVPSEEHEGMLVRVSAQVTRSWSDAYGAYITLRERIGDPDSLVVFLSFRHKPGIDLASLSPGDQVTVTGVVGQYVRGGPLNIGYELYPRYPEDIRVQRAETQSYLIAVLISVGLVVLALIWGVALRRQVAARTRQLQESERRFRKLLEDVQLVAVNVDDQAKITFVNEYFLNMSERQREEVIGRTWHELFGVDQIGGETPEVFRQRLLAGEMPTHCETEVVTRKGNRRAVAWTVTLTHSTDGKASGISGIGADITERKLTEQRLAASLLEKEVLLKEVYHRVKNNLQTVSSLLSLQAASIKDPAMREIFLENQQRVRSMALIHEKLYRSKTLANIDFREYLDGLATSLFRTYLVSGEVSLRVNVTDVILDIDTSITCGLLVNELLSNALKHAFPGGRSGEISITMHPAKQGEYTLIFADTGVGLPPGFDPAGVSTLGMSLMRNLVRQLGGTMEMTSNGGTRFEITFSES
jgi:PAS domain S-box-containing protein